MDFAYDHITTSNLPETSTSSQSPSRSTTPTPKPSTSTSSSTPASNLQTELAETLSTFQNSAWGKSLGGWWSSAKTQGGSYLEQARIEAEKARKVAEVQVRKGLEGAEDVLDRVVNEERRVKEKEASDVGNTASSVSDADSANTSRHIQASAQDSGMSTDGFLSRFRDEASKTLKEVQKAEDAADEALLRFGTNIKSFLSSSIISITAPADHEDNGTSAGTSGSKVVFESKDALTGRRIIHTTRLDAQLHLVHTTSSSFTQDPDTDSQEWTKWKNGFDVEEKTNDIANDLEAYPELRDAMEKYIGVEGGVEYKDFWTRYYFLRHVLEVREERRREMLKASRRSIDEEEVGWDDDDNDEDNDNHESNKDTKEITQRMRAATLRPDTPQAVNIEPPTPTKPAPIPIHTNVTESDVDSQTLKPRRSHDEKSVADMSEASYDIVSGAASHAASSPKEKAVRDDSDEEDWE